MSDPIKDFVDENREEFDHLEAPVLNLERLKSRIQQVPAESTKRNVLLMKSNSWLVAASVLLTLTCAALFYHNYERTKPLGNAVPAAAQTVASNPISDRTVVKPSAQSLAKNSSDQILTSNTNNEKAIANRNSQNTQSRNIFANLKDSTSASSRLLAILEIEKSGKVDNKLMDMMAATLNHDKNTNVRLAALSLLEKYRENDHVSTILINSLNKQDDPMVQLGLVSLLGKMKNIKIDDKLQALASNPDTFDAVRDEAYNILLNEDKL